MTEEPYRWLEAIANRREYVEGQLKGGSPVFAISLNEGILLLGIGTGQSKVFEIFDRHALAGLGHPADIERVRQGLIDAAHLEAFTRAAADVSLRRLVSYALSPMLKTAFEQIFAPPFLVRLILAEVGSDLAQDVLVSMNFDGSFALRPGGVMVVTDTLNSGNDCERWLSERIQAETSVSAAVGFALDAWRNLTSGDPLPEGAPEPGRHAVSAEFPGSGRTIEIALLARASRLNARYQPLEYGKLKPPPSLPPS